MKRKDQLTITRLVGLAGRIEDPRRRFGNRRHEMVDILVITLLAIVCGCETWKDIRLYGTHKEEWLHTFLRLPKGIPSISTFRRTLLWIKPEALEDVYRQWIRPYVGSCQGKQVCLDGKTVCGVGRHGEVMLHMVSAWVREDGITIGQISTDEKSNEITAIPKLIGQLDIRGGTVTIDAMGCQKAITEAVITGEGQYILAVKKNQLTLYEDIEEYFRWASGDETEQHHLSHYTQKDFGHGKIAHWRVTATKNTVWFESKRDWKALRSFVMVERTTEKDGKKSQECAYFISSLEADAATFQRLVRGHWSIENQLHWILDCQFNEDACLIHKGNAPENLSLIRKMALALLKRDTSSKLSIRSKQKLAGWNNDYALSMIL